MKKELIKNYVNYKFSALFLLKWWYPNIFYKLMHDDEISRATAFAPNLGHKNGLTCFSKLTITISKTILYG